MEENDKIVYYKGQIIDLQTADRETLIQMVLDMKEWAESLKADTDKLFKHLEKMNLLREGWDE